MTSKALRYGLMLGLVCTVTACGIRDRGPQSVGLPFDASLQTGDTWRDFTVTVAAAGATLDQARESARFEASRHCIDHTGSSRVDWVRDPASGDWAARRTDDGSLIVEGRCTER